MHQLNVARAVASGKNNCVGLLSMHLLEEMALAVAWAGCLLPPAALGSGCLQTPLIGPTASWPAVRSRLVGLLVP